MIDFELQLSKISPNERKILQCLALCYEPLNSSDFSSVLSALEIKTPEGKIPSANYLSLLRNSLIHKGVLRETKTAWGKAVEFASPELREYLSREAAAREDWFQNVVDKIRVNFPADQYSLWSYDGTRSEARLLRDFRLLVYSEKTVFSDVLEKMKQQKLQTAADQILLEIFLNPLQADFLQEFDRANQTAILSKLLKHASENFEPTAQLWEFVRENNLDEADFAEFQLDEFIFTGEIARAKNLIGAPQTFNKCLAAGTIALLEKDFIAARDFFETAIKAWRKTSGKRKGFPAAWQMFSYGLALYKTDEANFYKFLDEFYNYAEKNYSQSAAHKALKVLEFFLKNADGEARGLLNRLSASSLTAQLIKIIVAALVPATELSAAEVAAFSDRSRAAGFRWLELECQNLIALKGKPDSQPTLAAKEAADQLKLELGFEPLGNLIAPLAEWERALKVLTAVAINLQDRNPAKTAVLDETRVAWLLDFNARQIQPVEQKYGKNGWSNGRNIALKRLFQKDVQNLSEQDARVVKAALKREPNYYYQEYYHFKWEKALAALVGHEFLFLQDNPSVNVRLTAGEPILVVKQKKDETVELSFDTAFSEEGIVVQKETETRYKVVTIGKRHVEIAAVLPNKKLKIPEQGRAALLRAMQPLTGSISIESDLAEHFENLPLVAADARIHALVTPRGDGFHLEFFVKPFGKIPPYFKPGKNQESVIAELDGVRTRTKRDLKLERKLLNEIEESCPTLAADENPNYEWELANAEACLTVLLEMEAPRQAGKLVIEWTKEQKLKLLGNINYENLRLNVTGQNAWFEVSGETRINENLVLSMRELNSLLTESKGNFIEISDGQFVAITEKLRKQLQSLSNVTDEQGRLHNLRAGILEDFADELENFTADKTWREHLAKLQSIKNFAPELPATFEAELRPYQTEGYQWLSRLAQWGVGACLADDMGLGKTIMALAVLVERAERGAALVVAPVSVCRNWVKEAARFAPTLNFQLFGAGDRQATIERLGKFDVLVTSYNLLQAAEEVFTSRNFATILLDEAQAVKNRTTKRSKTVMALSGDFRIITTGTPIENHLGELWNLFNFVNPGLLGSYDFFNQRFAVPIEKNKDETARRTLQRLIQPFVLRRRKNQVLDDLPAKTEIVLTVEMSAEERAFYEALRRQALENIESETGEINDKRFRIMAELTRLRLACCHPQLVNENAQINGSKLELFGEVLAELLENKHKALVFSQFVKHLHLVEKYLQARGIKYHYLDGSTPPHVRQERIDEFQRGTGEIFLISLKAGGTGLNLTAADYVIHLDPWWNPAVEDQATDRVHRIGQQRPVTVYRLVTENTVEEKILKLHETKRHLADSLLDGTDASGKLSADDLLNLIKVA